MAAEKQRFAARREVKADHPCLAGHFPGRPVVPGVIVLEEVAEVLRQWHDERRLDGVRRVKFTAPLLPEQPFEVSLTLDDDGLVSFECRRSNQLIAKGQLATGNANQE